MIAKLVVSFWFRAVVSAAVVLYLVSRFDRQEAVQALLEVDARYFLVAILVDAAARATMIARWTLLLRSSATPVSVWSAARIFLITSFVGTALPAGGADVTRAYALSRQTDDGRGALASVAVDRLLGVTARATRFRRAGRGSVEVITFKPLSKNPGALQWRQRRRRIPSFSPLKSPSRRAVPGPC